MRKQTNWDRTRHRMLLRHYFEDVDYSRLRKALPGDDDADADGYDDRERDDDNDELEADENGETKPSPDLDDEHDDDTEHDDIAEPALPPQLEQAIAALIVANPTLTRQQVAFYLLHHPHGRAMISLLAKQKGQPMDRTTELRKIAKQYGVHKLAGLLVTENKSHGITEAELTSLIFEEAKKHMQPGERPNSAFARYYSAPEKIELRKAIARQRRLEGLPAAGRSCGRAGAPFADADGCTGVRSGVRRPGQCHLGKCSTSSSFGHDVI